MLPDSLLIRLGSQILSLDPTGFVRGRLAILIYHRVLPTADPLRPHEPTWETFSWQMELLSRHFKPLPLSSALRLMQSNELPDRAVCVTFDDGYADNVEVALPILQRFGIPATVFIASGFLNGGCMWNDRLIESVRARLGTVLDLRDQGLEAYSLESIPSAVDSLDRLLADVKHLKPVRRQEIVDLVANKSEAGLPGLMMTDAQVRALHQNGVEIGGHTLTHPILANLDEAEARRQIQGNKADLENLTDSKIQLFAYPNGVPGRDFNEAHIRLVREAGYSAACSTQWGVATTDSDLWQLPRFTPWDRRPWKFALRLMLNYRNAA